MVKGVDQGTLLAFYSLKWCQSDVRSLFELATIILNMEICDNWVKMTGQGLLRELHLMIESPGAAKLLENVAKECGFEKEIVDLLVRLRLYGRI